jgi:hypothetical protein
MDKLEQVRQRLDTVEDALADARALPDDAKGDVRRATFDELVTAARALHEALTEAGVDVQHDRHLVSHRGMEPSEPDFYRDLHAVEALVHLARRTVAVMA